MAKAKREVKEQPVEQALWASADKLRKNMDAAEYKHIVLGLIFLKYISDNFYELYHKLEAGEGDYDGADPDDPYEYRAENVFYVPPQARWDYLQNRAKLATIGKDVDDAMDAIEKDNPSLKGVLPKEYAREKLDKQSLGGLIDIISAISLGDSVSRSNDVLGRVYEYFLGQFALAEGKKGGQFYTPRCIVQLLVEMLEPYEGRVLDPCCGSGGMFVQSEKFIEAHAGRYNGKAREIDKLFESVVSVYGQESNQTTWRLCKMNLALRGIDSSNVKWNNEGSFLNDAHPDLKADFVIANPPFNDSDWSGELLRTDGRWKYGIPPVGNANYAWILHFLYHLSPKGMAGFVMHCSAASVKTGVEVEIRKKLLESGLVRCMVALPTQLFSNTTLPVHIWILSRKPNPRKEVMMIDAYDYGKLDDGTNQRSLSYKDIISIVKPYLEWKRNELTSKSQVGLYRCVSYFEIEGNNYILSPNRYVKHIERVNYSVETTLSSDRLTAISTYSGSIHLSETRLGTGEGTAKPDLIGRLLGGNDIPCEQVDLNEAIGSLIAGEWGDEELKKDTQPCIVLRGTDLPNVKLFNFTKTPVRYIKTAKVHDKQVQAGDIIIEMSGGSKDQPTGRTAFVTQELLDWFPYPILCSNFNKIIRPNTERVLPLFLFLYFQLAYADGLTTRYENQPSGIKNLQLDELISSELLWLPDVATQQQVLPILKDLFQLQTSMAAGMQRYGEILNCLFEQLYKTKIRRKAEIREGSREECNFTSH
jgi:type I restriction enzyme M protein